MKLAIIAALCGCSAAPAATATAPPGGAPGAARSDEAEVRARERAWLDAYEQRDPAAMEDILADDFLITFSNGQRDTRAAVVARMRQPRGPGDRPPHFATRNTVALARDGVIVLVGEVVQTNYTATGERRDGVSTYTDTWIRSPSPGGRWRVLASHLSQAPAP
jgi:ketosteroid isomerase-like protein